MNILKLVWRNICFKPLASIFNVLLLAMGVATILTLLSLNTQIENRFTKDLQGIDLVVSSKGSPLQIILSSVFHLDIPTGNIPFLEAEKLKANPFVKKAIPVALGDNYNGYHIVGTNLDYIKHYKGQLAAGQLFEKPMQAVVGSLVAQQYNTKMGDKIVGAHGLTGNDDLHTAAPYSVVGILKPTGSVLDRLVLTPVASVWHVHDGHKHAHNEHNHDKHARDDDDHKHHKHDGHHHDDHKHYAVHKAEKHKEITALLIQYKSPFAAMQLPRFINKNSALQAASPAFEIARLTNLMGVGSDILSAFGVLLIGFALFGFFVTLYNAIYERRYDIALMRAMGATKKRMGTFIMAEVLVLVLLANLLGLVLAHVFLAGARYWVAATKHLVLEPTPLFDSAQLGVCLGVLLLSVAVAIIPIIKAYRLNVIKVLTQG
jgi:putative ABC transport system permease protein